MKWALHAAGSGALEPTPLRLTLCGGNELSRNALASALRAADVVVATLPEHPGLRSCLAFARAWGYDAALVLTGTGVRLVRARDAVEKTVKPLEATSIVALKDWAQQTTKG